MFKTLVTVGKSGEHYVFMVPVEGELNLKKLPRQWGRKEHCDDQVARASSFDGIYSWRMQSAWHEKKVFPRSSMRPQSLFDTIMYSGGRRGCQICSSLADAKKLVDVQTVDITA